MSNTKRKRRKRDTGWSYSAGAWGKNRVRAFDRGQKGIYLDYWEATSNPSQPYKRVRIALGHSDRDRAQAKVDELAVAFRTCSPLPQRKPTLGELFDIYETEVTPTKGRSQRTHDRCILDMCRRFFGTDRDPMTLSRRDWDRYIAARCSGQIRPKSVKQPRPVGDRIIGADCIQLQAVFNWAVVAGDGHGGMLLARNPFKGFPMPKEANPRRPIVGMEYYEKLLQVAPRVDARFALALVFAYETGHRIGAIRTLRWNDIDLTLGVIRWRAANDKIGFAHVTPLREQAVVELQQAWESRTTVGTTTEDWVFPSPKDPRNLGSFGNGGSEPKHWPNSRIRKAWGGTHFDGCLPRR